MNEAQMREAVSSAFVSGWRAAQPGIELALENEGRALPLPLVGQFALLTIVMTAAAQRTQGQAGTRRVQRQAWVQVKLWTPPDIGAAGAAGLADSVRAILEMVSIESPIAGDEPITTQAAVTMPGGTDGRFYMSLVRVPLWFVETK